MGLSIKSIILYTKQINNLARFYVGLFDLQIVQTPDDDIYLSGDLFDIHIQKASADQLFAKNSKRDLLVELKTDSLMELEHLAQKFQFNSYRHHSEGNLNSFKIQKNKNLYHFDLEDPEGRPWRFSYCEEQQ